MSNAEGWAIILDGHEADLLDWEHALPPPFSPWVERYIDASEELHFLLRDASFPLIREGRKEVREQADNLVARLNGVMAAAEGAEGVRRGSGMFFRSDGLVDRILFAESGRYQWKLSKVRLRASAATGGPPAPPHPSEAQRWAALSFAVRPAEVVRADNVADLLDHLGRADNWYDVYKVLELANRLCGNDWDTLYGHPFAQPTKPKRLKQTVNHYRHAPGGSPLPKSPPSLDEAIQSVRTIAIGVLRMIDAGQDPRVPFVA